MLNSYSIDKKLKDMAFHALYISRAYLITRPLYSGIGTILTFHRVCPKNKNVRISGNLRLEVTPEYLENVIKFFAAHNYEAISLDRLYEILQSGRADKKFVIFTFDDGYADNFIYAYPIFKKYNIPFTIYVTTGLVERQVVLWHYLLEDLVLKKETISIQVNNKTFKFDCSLIDKKEDAFSGIRSLIIDSYGDRHLELIKSIFSSNGVDIYSKTDNLALSWKQVKELSLDPLVTIGAHSVNHLAMSTLSEKAARYEIEGSKAKLESGIGRSVQHFSYPFGTKNDIGERELRIAKECGFKTAVTAKQGNIFPAHKDYMECLPRAIISGEREGRNIQYLNLWTSGLTGCISNRFRQIAAL
jgi:peptidoglycan/xylan/chitin deacetylase (PgdA/CDA1 family)